MDYIEAHQFTSNNKEQLLKDKKCGCCYCLSIFEPKEIKSWIKTTAVCPYCSVDSVIGESSGYPITKEFLEEMNNYWF